MANYATLISAISNVIKTNGTNAITGAILQSSLITMINSLGAGYQFAGVAVPATNPGTPDQNVFYIAGPGTYPNFNNQVVPIGSVGVFAYNGSWTTNAVRLSNPDAAQIGECTTAAGTLAKTVSATNFLLFPGCQFRVKFTNATTVDNPSLNIGGTGAYPIIYDGSAAGANNSWEAGETVLVYFDGTNWQASNSQGGSGKFLTGERVKETGITENVTGASDELVTSKGVAESEMDFTKAVFDTTSLYDNTALQQYIQTNTVISDSTGRIDSNSIFDSLICPVESGKGYLLRGLQNPDKNNADTVNLVFYSAISGHGTPIAGQLIEFPTDDLYFIVPEGASYFGIVISARNFTPQQGGTWNFDGKNTVSLYSVNAVKLAKNGQELTTVSNLVHIQRAAQIDKLIDNDGNDIPAVMLRKYGSYQMTNAELQQYIKLNTVLDGTTGRIAVNSNKFDSILVPVSEGSEIVINGLQWYGELSDTYNIWFYSSIEGYGAVVSGVLAPRVPNQPVTLTVPSNATYVGVVITLRDYQGLTYDAKDTISINVVGGETRYTIWDTPTGDEIEEKISGAGGRGISNAFDMGLPRDLPKVYIESELLTVVVDGQGNPTNQITPLTTSKNEVGDLDLEDVTIRIEGASTNFEDAIVISYQGQSSLSAAKKNFSIDMKHKHRFGKWLPMDGFHLKGYNSDWLHIRDIMANRIYEQILQSRPAENRRPFCAANDFSTHDVALLSESAVLCHVDGFPIELYVNGYYWGLYSWNLKKHRSNYHLGKSDVQNIQIDPNWQTMTSQRWNWNLAEVRNPKSDSGNTEFVEGTTPNPGEVRTWWEGALANLTAITASTSLESLRSWMNVENWVDVILFEEFIGGWDVFNRNNLYTTWNGSLLTILPYDHDGSFGIGLSSGSGSNDHVGGDVVISPSYDVFTRAYTYCPWLSPLINILRPLLVARYKELRQAGIFSAENVKAISDAWTMQVGFDAYKDDLGRWTYEGYGASSVNPGFYDSTNRIIEWIGSRVEYLDALFV